VGYFLTVLGLFLCGVILAAANVGISFYAREYELERLALQRRAETLLREKEHLEVQKRLITEQPVLRDRARRELGLVEVNPLRRETVMVPEALRDKYRGVAMNNHLASAGSNSAGNSLMLWQEMLEQLAVVTKVQAAITPEKP
jgi:hypothetical protein